MNGQSIRRQLEGGSIRPPRRTLFTMQERAQLVEILDLRVSRLLAKAAARGITLKSGASPEDTVYQYWSDAGFEAAEIIIKIYVILCEIDWVNISTDYTLEY